MGNCQEWLIAQVCVGWWVCCLAMNTSLTFFQCHVHCGVDVLSRRLQVIKNQLGCRINHELTLHCSVTAGSHSIGLLQVDLEGWSLITHWFVQQLYPLGATISQLRLTSCLLVPQLVNPGTIWIILMHLHLLLYPIANYLVGCSRFWWMSNECQCSCFGHWVSARIHSASLCSERKCQLTQSHWKCNP